MIFVTVGMERFSFDRMVKPIDEAVGQKLIRQDVFIQTGYTKYTPVNCAHSRFLTFQEMSEQVRRADIVVCHAGIGSILICLQNGKVPILFPRRKKYQEHLDDHQLDISHCMRELSRCIVVFEEEELLETIQHYSERFNNLTRKHSTEQRERLVNYLNENALMK